MLLSEFGKKIGGKGESVKGSPEKRKIETLSIISVRDAVHVATPALRCPRAGKSTVPALMLQIGTGGVGAWGGVPAAFCGEGVLGTPWSIYRSRSRQQSQKNLVVKEHRDPQRSRGRNDKVDKPTVKNGKKNKRCPLRKRPASTAP